MTIKKVENITAVRFDTERVITLDGCEMMVRLAGALFNREPPEDMTAEQYIEGWPPRMQGDLARAAHAMADYFLEQMRAAEPTQ